MKEVKYKGLFHKKSTMEGFMKEKERQTSYAMDVTHNMVLASEDAGGSGGDGGGSTRPASLDAAADYGFDATAFGVNGFDTNDFDE